MASDPPRKGGGTGRRGRKRAGVRRDVLAVLDAIPELDPCRTGRLRELVARPDWPTDEVINSVAAVLCRAWFTPSAGIGFR